jgi:endonuclease YncB( thermonuclease family)/methylphosphotriester-DNA--protein-cysteine methyltransferase
MKIVNKTALVFVTLFLSAWFSVAQPVCVAQSQPQSAVANNVQLVIEGKVIDVHDGDTVTVIDRNNKKFHIRLQGIDAPELKQEFGARSQQNLSRLVLGKQVTVYWSKVDKYRRTVGTIVLDGQDMNIEQVKAGLAWHFKKYADEQDAKDRVTYAAAEQQARAAKLGLWQDSNPTAPGDWRQGVKAKRWGPPPPEGTIIGNRGSMKYHRPDCAGYRDMAEKNRVFFKTVAEAEAAGYKRAGNCPAEPQTVSLQPSSNSAIKSATATVAVPSASLNTSSSSVATTTTIGANGKVIGNRNSKVYHLPGCASYNQVSGKNQVWFDSAAEAEQAGYKRAGNCPVNGQ